MAGPWRGFAQRGFGDVTAAGQVECSDGEVKRSSFCQPARRSAVDAPDHGVARRTRRLRGQTRRRGTRARHTATPARPHHAATGPRARRPPRPGRTWAEPFLKGSSHDHPRGPSNVRGEADRPPETARPRSAAPKWHRPRESHARRTTARRQVSGGATTGRRRRRRRPPVSLTRGPGPPERAAGRVNATRAPQSNGGGRVSRARLGRRPWGAYRS